MSMHSESLRTSPNPKIMRKNQIALEWIRAHCYVIENEVTDVTTTGSTAVAEWTARWRGQPTRKAMFSLQLKPTTR